MLRPYSNVSIAFPTIPSHVTVLVKRTTKALLLPWQIGCMVGSGAAVGPGVYLVCHLLGALK